MRREDSVCVADCDDQLRPNLPQPRKGGKSPPSVDRDIRDREMRLVWCIDEGFGVCMHRHLDTQLERKMMHQRNLPASVFVMCLFG